MRNSLDEKVLHLKNVERTRVQQMSLFSVTFHCRGMGAVIVLAHVISAEKRRLWTGAVMSECE